ncbi:hypothetical protein [Clavibacter nebraskensis]|uniref:Uncharacterized protein n=4 Tax=Clavibacter nebraskensis TaxID=31963 RepID=A0AAI8ZHL2_9MICO|nr:hypothetical protein [Clavibacter nebraskensis]KXU20700.1 hypothetical protein VV38_07195 [Clavibacter nebraskensis]OAH20495.1 hypothetical protein A3Q38_04065 [Clavibacter nebraskensis]QGV66683.1 hypothetical protein EGX36_07530 [Clavibacter nebraskensis]QGV69480.1 hypothetical protein EGX37_07515 [Clavibacter nebraskensis]QGV72270.1 hypothetical protein EGX35_07515 [Clavibacter nebraskensis]
MTSSAPASPASDRILGSATTTVPAAAGAPASAFVALLVADGAHLTERVAEAADRLEAGGPAERYDARAASAEDALVVALALVAGGLDVRDAAQHAVDGDPAPVIQALHSLAGRGGVEPYLLRNGLTVDQFHALRDAVVAGGGRELDESQD